MKKHPRSIPLSSQEDLLKKLNGGSSLNLIISVSRDCVLQCNYCYAIDPKNLPPKRILSLDIVEKLIREAFQVRHRHISFEWTGGEAMLAGQGFYEKVLELQKKYAPSNKTYDNCMQTSGGIYNEAFIDFLIDNDFHLGLTIDGPRHIHEAQRPTKGGSSSFDTVLKTFAYLKKKQGRCGVLCTLTKNSLDEYKKIPEFYKEIGASGYHTNPYIHDPKKPIQSDRLGLTPQEYSQYFKNQFDTYLELDEDMIRPSYISSLMNTISGIDSGRKCTHGGRCLTNFLNIDDEGNATICPKFLGYENMRLGNIKTSTVAELISPENPLMKKLIAQRLKAMNSCESERCSYLIVCNSGCPYGSFLNGDDSSIEHRDYLCPGKHELYEHIDNRLQSFDMHTVTSVQGGVIESLEQCGESNFPSLNTFEV